MAKKRNAKKAEAKQTAWKPTRSAYPRVSEMSADDRTLKMRLSDNQWGLVSAVAKMKGMTPKAVLERSVRYVLNRLDPGGDAP